MMAYFFGLYISSGALTPDSMLCDLFGLKILFFKIKCVQVCACVSPVVQSCPIYVFHHPKAWSPVVMEMGHRCSNGSLDACDVIMEQEEEIVLL